MPLEANYSGIGIEKKGHYVKREAFIDRQTPVHELDKSKQFVAKHGENLQLIEIHRQKLRKKLSPSEDTV
jgi:hypothetical protein